MEIGHTIRVSYTIQSKKTREEQISRGISRWIDEFNIDRVAIPPGFPRFILVKRASFVVRF